MVKFRLTMTEEERAQSLLRLIDATQNESEKRGASDSLDNGY